MIQEDYVSFEIARLLKYKGADFDTDQVYTSMGRSWEIDMKQFKKQFDYDVSNYIQRPTLQMAMKWLREVYNLCIVVFPIVTDDDGSAGCLWDYIVSKHLVEQKRSNGVYEVYEDAIEDAIKYCLENLI